jgi:hypothetical protein
MKRDDVVLAKLKKAGSKGCTRYDFGQIHYADAVLNLRRFHKIHMEKIIDPKNPDAKIGRYVLMQENYHEKFINAIRKGK